MSSGFSNPLSERVRLLSDLTAAFRKLSGQAVLFSETVADRLGMAPSDVECLEVLVGTGPLTAGRLAEVTGLTTGAVTRMIDRLEQAGYVRRTTDPSDRRRVVVAPVPERTAGLGPLFGALTNATAAGMAGYSDDQLRLVLGFLEQALDLTRAETARLRDSAPEAGDGPRNVSAPLGSVTAGRLVFQSGLSDLRLSADPELGELFRAQFSGTPPRVRVRGGTVGIRPSRFPLDWLSPEGEVSLNASIPWNVDFRKGLTKLTANVRPRVEIRTRGRGGEAVPRNSLALNASIPWEIDFRGGISRLTADLRAGRLSSFEITGGATNATILLPRPEGPTPIRIVGGTSDLTIRRPEGAGVLLRLKGGVSGLVLDDREFASVGGEVHLESNATTDARYEVELIGGASKVRIETRGG